MSSICLPVPLVLLLRRLFNAFSAFSISQTYLTSRLAPSYGLEAKDPSSSDDTILKDEKSKEQEETPEDVKPTSAWNLLERLKKALPSRERGDPVKLSDLHSDSSFFSQPIHRIMSNPQLFDPVRAPRHPVVLCHGLYGFDVRGPEAFPKLRMHYWSNVLHILRNKVGAEVIVTGVPGTGSIASRAERMDRFLKEKVKDRDINFLAHSMGGLDCRHLITHIVPQEYNPLSLTSLSAPHRGSPFMDWCLANIGIGSPRPFPFPNSPSETSSTTLDPSTGPNRTFSNPLPYSLRSPLLRRSPTTQDSTASFTLSMLLSSFTSLILSLIDSPAYANLTTSFMRDIFNPSTPDKPDVKYFSVAARTTRMSIWHPLWLPKLIIDAAEEQEMYVTQRNVTSEDRYHRASDVTVSYPDLDLGRDRDPERGNDGLVTVSSAKWGQFLGTMEGCDHWELRGARGLGAEWDEGWGKMWRELVGKWGDSADKTELLKNVKSNAEKEERRSDWATRNELASRFDLEKFYVSLCRKLYEEGL